MKQYGVGSSYQQAAQLVKKATLPAKGEPTPEQKAANQMGQAVVGAW